MDKLIDIIEKPFNERMIVSGGPGTGKTEIIMRRVKHLHEKGTIDIFSNVLILSFTRAAVHELKKRFNWMNLVTFFSFQIYTFDHFASRLIFNNVVPGEIYQLRSYDTTIKDATELLRNGKIVRNSKEICILKDLQNLIDLKLIMVDEIQDLKGIRAEFLDSIFNFLDNKGIDYGFTILGDPNQEIFGYESEFMERGVKFKKSTIFTNYLMKKYTNIIHEKMPLDVANNPRFKDLDQEVKKNIEHMVSVIECDNEDYKEILMIKVKKIRNKIDIDSASAIIEEIKGIPKEETIAFLFRTNKKAIAFSLMLLKYDVKNKIKLTKGDVFFPRWLGYIISTLKPKKNDEGVRQINKDSFIKTWNNLGFSGIFNLDQDDAWSILSMIGYNIKDRYAIELPILYDKITKNFHEKILGEIGYEQSRITVSTIHRAKGLEFDHVYLEDYILADEYKGYELKRLREEAKNIYVALTRAKKNFKLLGYGYQFYRNRFGKSASRPFNPKYELLQRPNDVVVRWLEDNSSILKYSFLKKEIDESFKLQNDIWNNLDIGDKISIHLYFKNNNINKPVCSLYSFRSTIKGKIIGKLSKKFANSLKTGIQLQLRRPESKRPEFYKWIFGGLQIVSLNTEVYPRNKREQEIIKQEIALPFIQWKFWLGFRVSGPLYLITVKENR